MDNEAFMNNLPLHWSSVGYDKWAHGDYRIVCPERRNTRWANVATAWHLYHKAELLAVFARLKDAKTAARRHYAEQACEERNSCP